MNEFTILPFLVFSAGKVLLVDQRREFKKSRILKILGFHIFYFSIIPPPTTTSP